MVFKKFEDGNGGRWVLKKKFSFAAAAFITGTLFAAKGIHIAETTESAVVVLSAYGTYCGWLLGLIFAADITDKALNNGSYDPKG